MFGLIIAALRLIEVLLLTRIILGYVGTPKLKPLELAVRAITSPMIEVVRLRMKQPASPDSAAWWALAIVEAIRIAISMVLN